MGEKLAWLSFNEMMV